MAGKKGRSGARSTYTSAIGDEICRRLAEGETLQSICRDAHIPSIGTVMHWVADDRGGFQAQYACAREAQAHVFAGEIVDLADAGEARMANVELLRVRIDARKWFASKVLPKRYGDRVQQDVTASVEIVDADALDSRLDRAIAAACAAAGAGGAKQD